MTDHIKIDIEGYYPNNYDKNQGINPSGEDVISNKLIDKVIDLILSGYADRTIRDALCQNYHLNSYACSFIINKAHKELNNREEKQSENLYQKQMSRLFLLYRRALEKDDQKTALTILAEINKISKLYTQKIEVSSDVFTLDLGLNTTNNEDKQ